MNEITSQINSIGWWFSAVVVAIVVNLVSQQISKMLDAKSRPMPSEVPFAWAATFFVLVVSSVVYARLSTGVSFGLLGAPHAQVVDYASAALMSVALPYLGYRFLCGWRYYQICTLVLVVLAPMLPLLVFDLKSLSFEQYVAATTNMFAWIFMAVTAVAGLFYLWIRGVSERKHGIP